MGSSNTKHPGLTEDVLEDYTTLTYLKKGEILHLMKKFYSIDPAKMDADLLHRFEREVIINKFDVLKCNPFLDRIFCVFSSKKDDCFSFEDLLDLCWAFRIFDMDGDNNITDKDIIDILNRLTRDSENQLDEESKNNIAKTILKEMNFDNSSTIGLSEFKLVLSRMPEFASSFYFRL